MRRVSFRLPSEEKEDLLDALMPLLPAGVRERLDEHGDVELTTTAAAPPDRAALEAAVGRPLAGWHEEDVPADWRARRARFGDGAFLVGGRILIRSPWDPPAGADVLDLVIERGGGGGFGSGSHATTRMCLALLVGLEPAGGAADLGCGLGTLAIAAARLGWSPVVAVDRMEGAVVAARANGTRNGVAVDWRVADLETDPIPPAPLLLVNAPPPVHARVAAALAAAPDPTAAPPPVVAVRRRRPPPRRPRPRPSPAAHRASATSSSPASSRTSSPPSPASTRPPAGRSFPGSRRTGGRRRCWSRPVGDDVLDPSRAAAAGAAFGQLACALPAGGLLISASRLVELNVRATILVAPGLFRLDLTPQEETLGVVTRALTSDPVHWRADQSTWDGYRDADEVAPLELHARFELPDGPLTGRLQILSFADRDVAAVHFVAKAEIREP